MSWLNWGIGQNNYLVDNPTYAEHMMGIPLAQQGNLTYNDWANIGKLRLNDIYANNAMNQARWAPWGNALSLIGTFGKGIFDMWNGYNAYSQAKDAFNLQKKMAIGNYNTQAQLLNEQRLREDNEQSAFSGNPVQYRDPIAKIA